MKISKQVAMAAVILGFGLVSCSKDDNDDTQLNSTDQNFITSANLSNNAEIDAGTLAATKGNSAGVKMFGSMMVTEHTTAKTDLKSVGTNVGVAVRDTIDAPHIALKQQLSATALTGRAFDSVYIINQVADHQATLARFDAEIGGGNHAQVRNYAMKYRPNIQNHLRMADSIAVAMKFK
jgi:putative membrane protein